MMSREGVDILDTFCCLNETEGDEDYFVCPFLTQGLCFLGRASGYRMSPCNMPFMETVGLIPTTCPLEKTFKDQLDDILQDIPIDEPQSAPKVIQLDGHRV